MAHEIERKFRVTGEGWRQGQGTLLRQGYLSREKESTVRVRLVGERARLTIKGITRGIRRREFEYEIPVEDAEVMLEELCAKPLIEKRRYRIESGPHTWEVDEFFGDNEGLVIAEIELESEDESFEKPAWLGEEVSDDPRYFNANLVEHPYSTW